MDLVLLPRVPLLQQSQIPPGRGQGCPQGAGLRPGLPLVPVSSQAAAGLQAHLHLPQWPAGSLTSLSWSFRAPSSPKIPVSLRASGQAESPQLSLGLPPLFLQPCPTSLTSPPGQAWPLLGRVTPHLALRFISGQAMCCTCKPWEGIIPSAWHWGGCIPVQNPHLGAQGLLGHPTSE